ncbi:MAG: hypothetical protein DRO88_04005 [Promethearchaeia archaeon]|nr:MAG: hypothetical protein DRO88_04005 [Candidatus Lokiarchaeia archaeon]
MFNPQIVARRLNKFTVNIQAKKQKKLELKIEKEIRFNVEYQPNLIVKCPKCGFDNPMRAKTCFNCGFKLNF